jgi:hypothetical protein
VPVRLSFKFILNASGHRPATGAVNTDATVNAQAQRANLIWAALRSEFGVDNLEIVDVNGVSDWYNADISQINALRTAAMRETATYRWRNDAVNVYITAADGSAISDMPPSNDIILMCQGSHDTTLAHEVGHILNLYHTQDPDGCADTLMDNENWSLDDIAVNNFGSAYALLSAVQRQQVDSVWWNVMSYHNVDNRTILTPCQMDRQSTQAYADRSRLLSIRPVYVDVSFGGPQNGSFTQPYQSIQQVINAGLVNGNVLVLESGTHPRPNHALWQSTTLATRRAASSVQDAPPAFSLPYTLEDSTNMSVRTAVIEAQRSDRRGDLLGVIAHLQEAEKHATGRQKTVLQLQLGQRFRDRAAYAEAADFFKRAADSADQHALRMLALSKASAAERAATQLQGRDTGAHR